MGVVDSPTGHAPAGMEERSLPFAPAWWLPSAHLQTLWPSFFRPRLALEGTWERVELADGDFIDLVWHGAGDRPLVLVIHGLREPSRPWMTSTRGLSPAPCHTRSMKSPSASSTRSQVPSRANRGLKKLGHRVCRWAEGSHHAGAKGRDRSSMPAGAWPVGESTTPMAQAHDAGLSGHRHPPARGPGHALPPSVGEGADSPFTIHHSLFTVHCSLFTIHWIIHRCFPTSHPLSPSRRPAVARGSASRGVAMESFQRLNTPN